MNRRFTAIGKFKPNLIIGGVASEITTKAVLANKLTVTEQDIRNFNIIGNDVYANIRRNFGLVGGLNGFNSNSLLTYINDLGGNCTSIGTNGLRSNPNLEWVNLPSLTTVYGTAQASIGDNPKLTDYSLPKLKSTIPQFARNNALATNYSFPDLEEINGDISNCFQGLVSMLLLSMRKLKKYGETPNIGNGATISGFGGLKYGCIIEVNIAISTANSGSAHAALLYAKNQRGAIVRFYDNSGNYVSTL